MYGSIIGDLAGSIYEYQQLKKVTPIICNNIIEPTSFISDDTILTIAILDALLTNQNYEYYLKLYGNKYKNQLPSVTPYFKTVFSPGFTKWLEGENEGHSIGNGAMMRISPIGYLCNTEEEIINNVHNATIPSHNSKEALRCAEIIALIIFYARKGLTKEEIIKIMSINLKNRKLKEFNYTCSDTIDICLYTVFNSSSFEESIRKILLYGGDTDTNACIVGGIAEALYGIDQTLIEEANNHLPKEFVHKLVLGYKNIQRID